MRWHRAKSTPVKAGEKTWLWLCCRLTLWPQSSTIPLLVLDLIKTKTTPKSINMKLISIYQERSISSSKPCWLRKPPRGTMLINQTNCLTNQSETNLYLLFMLNFNFTPETNIPISSYFFSAGVAAKTYGTILLILFTYYLSSDFFPIFTPVLSSIRAREQWARADDDDCGKSPGPGPYLQRLSRWSVMLSRGSPLLSIGFQNEHGPLTVSRTIINQKKSLQKTFAAWWHF